jgi:predicted dehydrogenase
VAAYPGSVRRGQLEQRLDLLAAAREPAPPTILMYRANLSYAPLHRLIRELVDKGLLREVDPADVGRWRSAIRKPEPKPNNRVRALYVATDAGLGLLDAIRPLREIPQEDGGT